VDRVAETFANKSFSEMVHDARKDVTRLTPEEARQQLDAGGVLLIDVGEAWQLRERGTISGARNVSHDEIGVKAGAEEERRDPNLQDRHQKIILTCGGGGKAARAAGTLLEMGFTEVAIIQGGCRGWQKAGFALEPYPVPDSDGRSLPPDT
jgi:rhodanese-related sulfurtransferase